MLDDAATYVTPLARIDVVHSAARHWARERAIGAVSGEPANGRSVVSDDPLSVES